MRLTILGGGGFRVPLIYRALLDDLAPGRVTRLTLYDLDPSRLDAIAAVLDQQAEGVRDAPEVVTTTDLDEALRGTDFVFVAVRVNGLEGRALDERLALEEGVLGQETVGAGGISYGLRTIPVAVQVARRVATVAPDAWVINFTNPAGAVTEAMTPWLGERVIGICDTPVGLGRRVVRALGVDPASATVDYVGLNHLGWLRGVRVGGRDVLPRLFDDAGALESFEEGVLFGADWLRILGAVPNEYLHYYYFHREAVAAARASGQTRGAFLLQQQQRFYAETRRDTRTALAWWDRTRREREATYMAENRLAVRAGGRDACDLESGGYEQVALSLMGAIARDRPARLILNVPNRGVLHELPADAVVEVPCAVDANGARPLAIDALPDYAVGLVCAVKAVERNVIHAATSGSRAAAVRALATHPLIDSVAVAGRLLDAYQRHLPALAYLR
ncbi:MAG TPA: 6-phospho-beta-glucosidase [Kineosporiaceae bacterium]